ncbi:ABC transporter permease [Anoxynatronum buryatiense]|uniref:Peptide/nickel transport system permease protein n=1 Tax=Anoxynatronum buryatiense TaxID=489973 RepID=A0AA45WYB3_9CLOT|nr:ABC transporter permease [Anoxynatronum buryatiense]SMP62770.1 peptide/nickel transport system permease protein [Anoxynatronum buryatiense]
MIRRYVITFVFIVTVNFLIPRLMPGDPFLYLSVEDGQVNTSFSEEQTAYYRSYYGLDQSLLNQYIRYINNLMQGDLGTSIYHNVSVVSLLAARFPWTLALVLVSMTLSCLLGVLLGSLSVWFRNRRSDEILYTTMIILSEIPPYLAGAFLLYFMAAKWQWFPLSGGISPFNEFSLSNAGAYLKELLWYGALPVTTLVLTRLGGFYLITRNSLVMVFDKEYMKTAKGKGLTTARRLFRHALRNALPPILTRYFMSLGMVFGSAVLVENVFRYPGIGRLMQEAVMTRDYVLLQGVFLLMAVSVLLMNLLADLLSKKLDPRVS